jgi:hypothetical protein
LYIEVYVGPHPTHEQLHGLDAYGGIRQIVF